MQKRSSRDINVIAARLIEETTGISLSGKNAAAVALGRKGGLKGGKARAAKLSPAERKSIAKRAALARWSKVEE
jgi:hypothetical protein